MIIKENCNFMSDEYLTKEEIRRWRSSVEKITLEDYAARLGKKVQEAKKTNDLADLVYRDYNPTENVQKYDSMAKLEKIDITPKIIHAEKTHQKEVTEIKKAVKQTNKTETKSVKEEKTPTQPKANTKEKPLNKKAENKKSKNSEPKEEPKKETKPVSKKANATAIAAAKADLATDKLKIKKGNLEIEFTKALTDREEKVLEYFIKRRGEIVFAKDLAELLELKRDYIYKYIKNLRAKMTVDLIINADDGGFKLS